MTAVPSVPTARSSWRSIAVFVALAYGLAWLVCLPLWLGDGLASRWFLPCATIMMFTPTVAAVVATKGIERQPRLLTTLGLWPVRSWARLVQGCLLAIGSVLLLILLAQLTGAALGRYQFDLRTFAGAEAQLQQTLDALGQGKRPASLPPLPVYVLVQLAVSPINALLVSFLTVGEEIGWRGFLQPRLLDRLGPLGSVVVSGVVWGLWHAPLVLLGYNYPTLPAGLRLLWMCCFCVIVATVLAWLAAWGRSTIPAAVGHGTLNACLGTFAVLLGATAEVDTANATLLGWTGWIPGVVAAALLLATHRLRPEPRAGAGAPT